MMRQKRLEARKLRTQGISVKEIALRLDVRKETASKWVRDIELTELQVDDLAGQIPRYRNGLKGAKVNQEKARKNRETFQQSGREKAREGSLLHLKGCMLYWAEGAKSRHNVYLVNSDPNILYLFIRFLRQELHVTDDKIGLL